MALSFFSSTGTSSTLEVIKCWWNSTFTFATGSHFKPRIHDATRCTTGCTTRKMSVYTIQPVVQPAVSCIQTFSCWTNRLYEFNMFDSCNPTSKRSIVYTDLQPVVQPVASCIRSFSILTRAPV